MEQPTANHLLPHQQFANFKFPSHPETENVQPQHGIPRSLPSPSYPRQEEFFRLETAVNGASCLPTNASSSSPQSATAVEPGYSRVLVNGPAYPPTPESALPTPIEVPKRKLVNGSAQQPVDTPIPTTSADAPPTTLSNAEPAAKKASCARCKGLKYGFTPYFHNAAIFPTPPHALLPLIEQSQLLLNKLSSLLLNYCMRPIAASRAPAIEQEIMAWGEQIHVLLREVRRWAESEGWPLGLEPSREVRAWTAGMVEGLRERVQGRDDRREMRMRREGVGECRGRLRRAFEGVWRGWLVDRERAGLENFGDGRAGQ